MKQQKRAVVMQDLSCFGKCSLTVILPVMSAMGIECAVLPTAVLSTHTAFPRPHVVDLSQQGEPILAHWETVGARFDGILTGYLANPEQARLAHRLMDRFGGDVVVTDPAMGDHGRLYAGIGPEMVATHAALCARADLALPNITEAALMTGMEYRDTGDTGYCRELARELVHRGCGSVMLTGATPEPGQIGFFWTDGTGECSYGAQRLPRSCHGTGDLFAAVTTGGLLRGMTPGQAGTLACEFVRRAIAATGEDPRFGVAFEGELGWLAVQVP